MLCKAEPTCDLKWSGSSIPTSVIIGFSRFECAVLIACNLALGKTLVNSVSEKKKKRNN